MYTAYFAVFAIAFLLAIVCTPIAGRLGHRLGWVDQPDGRRRHHGNVPRLGGIALYAAFVGALLMSLILPATWLPPRLDPKELTRLAGLLVGTTFVFIAGLVDDRYELSPAVQLAIQVMAGLIAIAFIIHIKHVNNPFTSQLFFGPDGFPAPIVWALTIFWFAGMMNTVNWLDGLDGLAAGVGAILCAVLALHMFREGQYSVVMQPLALLGATLGFLPFNFHPARVFMGSAGSYVLGFALAALGIIGGAKMATVLLVMGLPILDVAWLILRRWHQGRSPGQGARDHLHFRLVDKGLGQRTIVLGYYVFSAGFGALALAIGPRLYKLIALMLLGAIGLGVLWWANRGEPPAIPHPREPDALRLFEDRAGRSARRDDEQPRR
ncbi:MAG: MraY family glycosyltransferase [Anaerolineae bacterium]|nr:undecaprenyl/decaprenyl-phosphate alpha-N-acetylglucosaminyl 1-phosphate transferase [Anaerolineae bacterium]MDW8098296.1 MraY family glycosyltransferase [Anaerolineae bacterium]